MSAFPCLKHAQYMRSTVHICCGPLPQLLFKAIFEKESNALRLIHDAHSEPATVAPA